MLSLHVADLSLGSILRPQALAHPPTGERLRTALRQVLVRLIDVAIAARAFRRPRRHDARDTATVGLRDAARAALPSAVHDKLDDDVLDALIESGIDRIVQVGRPGWRRMRLRRLDLLR